MQALLTIVCMSMMTPKIVSRTPLSHVIVFLQMHAEALVTSLQKS
jgi:hypothetical protein